MTRIKIKKNDISVTHDEYCGQKIELPAKTDFNKDIKEAKQLKQQIFQDHKLVNRLGEFPEKKLDLLEKDSEKYYQLTVYQKDHYKECEKFKEIIEKLNKSKEAIENEIRFFDSRNPPQSHVHQDMFLKIINEVME